MPVPFPGGAVTVMQSPMLVNYSQGKVILGWGDLIVGSTDGILGSHETRKKSEWVKMR